MAIIDPATYADLVGSVSSTGVDSTSIATLCTAVDAAVKRLLRPFHPEPLTVSSCVLDAPPDRDLYLPITPVRSITSVYYRADAYGVAANFTSDYLIDNSDGDEYQLDIDDKVNSYSRKGILRRIGRVWGVSHVRPLEKLAYKVAPERGSILVNYAAGPTSVPADITAAAVQAVTLMYQRRKTGMPVQSESWNGYSYSGAAAFTAEAAIRTPDVLEMLKPYMAIHVA
jgi:hypothetical protein